MLAKVRVGVLKHTSDRLFIRKWKLSSFIAAEGQAFRVTRVAPKLRLL